MIFYTALGDSITAGASATSPAQAYPHLIVTGFRSRSIPAAGRVVAQIGWTSSQLAGAVLSTLPSLGKATTISLWVGGNDIAYAGLAILRGAPASILQRTHLNYGSNLERMVTAIRSVSSAHIVLCSQYNPFPNSPVAEQGIGELNSLTAAAAARLGTAFAPVDSWFVGKQNRLIAGYRTGRIQDALNAPMLPIHPNNAGHLLIARNLSPFIR